MAAPIRMDYFTDPYCAWSWAFQPTLEELLRLEEDGVAITYRGKPLIMDLQGSGVSPLEIAKAWEKVGRLTGVPIDATLWRKQPPHSTLPAIHAAKAAGSLGRGAEGRFMHALFPMLMTEGRSADDPDTLHAAAQRAGLDVRAFDEALERDFGDVLAEDARLAAEYGIKSTPAVVLSNRAGDRVVVEGLRDLELLKRAIDVLRVEEDMQETNQPRITSTSLMPESPSEVRSEQTW